MNKPEYDLTPVRTIYDLSDQEFLPEWHVPLDSASTNLNRIVLQGVLALSEEPMPAGDLVAATRIWGERVPPHRTQATLQYFRRRVVRPGLAVVVGGGRTVRTGSMLEATEALRKAIPLLGVLAAWQLRHDDVYLPDITGISPSSFGTEPYELQPTRRLRILQEALVNETVTSAAAQACLPGIRRRDVGTTIAKMVRDGVLEAAAGERHDAHEYTVPQGVKAPILELLRGIASLDDRAYRDAAGKALRAVVSNDVMRLNLLALRKEVSHAPAWLRERIVSHGLDADEQTSIMERLDGLFNDGIICDAPDETERLTFAPKFAHIFSNRPSDLRLYARSQGLERLIYVGEAADLAAELQIPEGMTAAQYLTWCITPIVDHYRKRAPRPR